MVHHADIGPVIEAGGVLPQVAAGDQQFLDLVVAVLGEDDLPLLLVVVEGLRVLDQLPDHGIDGAVEVGPVLGGAGDDEGRARLVDQDGVHLVDNGEVVRPLHHLVHVIDEVVPQIVEAELVVGAIGDVGGVGALALPLAQAIDDHAGGHAQELVDLAHPLRVPAGEVVIHCDQVHPFAGQGVEVAGQGGHQGLALAGAHLGDAPRMQHHAAHQLHVEMAHAQHPLGRFPHHGEGFLQQAVEGCALGQTLAEFHGLGGEFGVRQLRHRRLQRIDRGHPAAHRLELAFVGRAEELFRQREHGVSESPRRAGKDPLSAEAWSCSLRTGFGLPGHARRQENRIPLRGIPCCRHDRIAR